MNIHTSPPRAMVEYRKATRVFGQRINYLFGKGGYGLVALVCPLVSNITHKVMNGLQNEILWRVRAEKERTD